MVQVPIFHICHSKTLMLLLWLILYLIALIVVTLEVQSQLGKLPRRSQVFPY